MTDKPKFVWKGVEVSTAGDVINVIWSIAGPYIVATGALARDEGDRSSRLSIPLSDRRTVESCQADATEFMAAYRTFTPNADENVGYLIGYHGGSDAASVRERQQATELFGVAHPVFGEGPY